LEKDGSVTHCLYDTLVFNKIKKIMGGKVRLMVSGSAPISSDVLNFLKVCFCSPIIEGYGQTEGTATEFFTEPADSLSGHVGGPVLATEYKLVDIPEMNYTSQDKDENGSPTPRGEIWVKGNIVIPGYFKNDEKNRETFTKDGWMLSGDIGMIVGPNKRLKIIDRKKNLFKLSQGEYIAPEKLENFYKLSHPSISVCYVYGDSLKSCLVGVINVDSHQLEKFAKEFGLEGSTADVLSKSPAVKKQYLILMDKIAKEKKLNSLEKLKDIHIEIVPFAELGLMTEAFKVKRQDIKVFYKKLFDQMYAKLN